MNFKLLCYSILQTCISRHVLLLFLFLITIVSCTSKSEPTNKDQEITTEENSKKLITESTQPGETLFKNNCAVCHSPNANDSGGVGLQQQMRNLPSTQYFRIFVSNSDSLLKTGEVYTKKIYAEITKEGSEVYNHQFGTTLTKAEILAIQSYLEY